VVLALVPVMVDVVLVNADAESFGLTVVGTRGRRADKRVGRSTGGRAHCRRSVTDDTRGAGVRHGGVVDKVVRVRGAEGRAARWWWARRESVKGEGRAS
jgi:hypothetical protein